MGPKFQPSKSNLLVFQVTSPILEVSGSPQPPVILLAYKRHSYNSRESKSFRDCMPGTWDKDQIFIFHYITLIL